MSHSFALFLLAETPLHAGAGSTLSAIDLPIQREIHTQHPVVWASGLKGALREKAGEGRKKLPDHYLALFGPETGDASAFGGTAVFSEARVVLFPVACTTGIFVWVTSPMALARLSRDFRALGATKPAFAEFLKLSLPRAATQAASSDGAVNSLHFDAGASVAVDPSESAKAQALSKWFQDYAFPLGGGYQYWRDRLATNFAVVPDEEFNHLVRYATQLQSHVKIGLTGTVEEGPWIEESLPPETLLMASIVLTPILDDKVKKLLGTHDANVLVRNLVADDKGSAKHFQMCGGRSTGMGWVAPRLLE